MSEVPEPTFTDRGFAHWEPTRTDYGHDVCVYESSAAMSPHIWLTIDKGEPASDSDLPAIHAPAHLSLEQAEEVHAKLGAAIEFTKARWGS